MKSVQSNQREHRNSKEHEKVSGMHVVSSITKEQIKKKRQESSSQDSQALRDFLIKE